MKSRGDIIAARHLISQFNGTHGRWLSNRDIPPGLRNLNAGIPRTDAATAPKPHYLQCAIGDCVKRLPRQYPVTREGKVTVGLYGSNTMTFKIIYLPSADNPMFSAWKRIA